MREINCDPITPTQVVGKIRGVPILLYHDIVASKSCVRDLSWQTRKYLVTAADFQRQLGMLRQSLIRVCSLTDVRTHQVGGNSEMVVVISIDDGQQSSFIFAYPALAALGLSCEFFVTTNQIGRKGYLGWPEIREMHEAGMSFQSHSAVHVDLRQLGEQDLRTQLKISKQTLEDHLAAPVSFLAAPYGLVSRQVLAMASEVGYRGVCSTLCWPAQPGANFMGRIAIRWGTNLRTFKRIVEKDWRFYLGTRVCRAVLSPAEELGRRFLPGHLGVSYLRSNMP